MVHLVGAARGILRIVGLSLLAVSLPSSAQPVRQSATARCDEACLSLVLDRYLTGLLAHDPASAPLARSIRFSENNVMLDPGDGLWGTISALDRSKGFSWFDPDQGEIGYLGVVDEHGLPAYLAARFKVQSGQIVELETIINRKEPGPRLEPKLYHPDPFVAAVLPAEQRTARSRMIQLTDGYFSTLQLNDGKIFTVFADDCRRAENGLVTAGAPTAEMPKLTGCAHQLKLGELKRITAARARTYFVLDEKRGLIFSRVFLDHAGVLTEYPRTDGTIMDAGFHKVPQTWCVLEVFKIVSGKISRIQAVMIGVPYRLPTPWASSIGK